MSRTIGFVLFLAFTSVVYAARSNICLSNVGTAQPYRPLQLYPADCPTNASYCMAEVYKYNAVQFKSNGPATLIPTSNSRESYAYMTQDESDNLNIVVISATSYKNNIIKTTVEMDGAAPGVDTIVRDDPTEDQWFWNPSTNSGNFSWLLQPSYTDGVVLGNIKIVSDFCFRVDFKPNWGGAIAKVVFLSGNVTRPTRVIAQTLTTSSGFFEFCQYPKAVISKTDAACGVLGSASATSLSSGTASYLWTNAAGTTIGTSSSITGLAAGNYNVRVTVNGCSAERPVTIGVSGVPISATSNIVHPTRVTAGSIALTISGGNPPFSITWKNPAGTVVGRNITTLSVTAGGIYSVVITDGCFSETYTFEVNAPGACPAGTFIDGDDCEPCAAGTYSTVPDATRCTVCPPGTWNTVTGATSCNTCAANTVSGGATGPCSACPVSTFSAAGSGECTACAPGTHRPSGATSCTACPAGSFRCEEEATCEPCPAGTFSAAGTHTCTACDPGTVAAAGASSCSECPADSFAAAGAPSCNACPAGKSAPARSSVLLACM